MYSPIIDVPHDNETLPDYITRTLNSPEFKKVLKQSNHRIQFAENTYRELTSSELTQNAEADGDPTNTKTIRKKFSAEMYKRFRAVKSAVNHAIKDKDVLGIKQRQTNERVENFDFEVPPVRDFQFDTKDRHQKFMSWLDETFERGVLGKGAQSDSIEDRWTDQHVRRSYRKGVRDAGVRARGILPGDPADGAIASKMARPVHATALETVFSRTFDQLEGVKQASKQTISRVLADGIAEGVGSERMARRINKEGLDNVGLNRARTIARTETINAYNQASLNEYERLGFNKVAGKAEWMTAGDLRVCPRCAGLEGIVLKIKRARGLIPLHPNCRCTWLPVVDEDRLGSRLKTKRRAGTLGNLPTGDARRQAREAIDT